MRSDATRCTRGITSCACVRLRVMLVTSCPADITRAYGPLRGARPSPQPVGVTAANRIAPSDDNSQLRLNSRARHTGHSADDGQAVCPQTDRQATVKRPRVEASFRHTDFRLALRTARVQRQRQSKIFPSLCIITSCHNNETLRQTFDASERRADRSCTVLTKWGAAEAVELPDDEHVARPERALFSRQKEGRHVQTCTRSADRGVVWVPAGGGGVGRGAVGPAMGPPVGARRVDGRRNRVPCPRDARGHADRGSSSCGPGTRGWRLHSERDLATCFPRRQSPRPHPYPRGSSRPASIREYPDPVTQSLVCGALQVQQLPSRRGRSRSACVANANASFATYRNPHSVG